MKQINVSTVKMTCDAQVINIDAHLVANAIKAQMRMQSLSDLIVEVYPAVLADNEDEKAKPQRHVDQGRMHEMGLIPMAAAMDFVQEFLDNLANAFLEDGDNEKK